jgi:putative flippase GtrA
MLKDELIQNLLRFIVVGGVVTLTFMALNKLFGPRLGKNRAFFAAYPPAVLLHFCLNKWWTFGSDGAATPRQITHYLILMVTALAIQWSVFHLLTRYSKMRPWIASGAATAAQMAIAFVAMQTWIFASGVRV